jgi:predicted DCC family thiol-disulfide oxidoreductase YuxK
LSNLEPTQSIVFFDGVCNLCNRFVDWIIRHDQQGKISFAPLQGVTAKNLFQEKQNDSEIMQSVIYWDNGEIFRGDDAVLRILAQLGTGCRILASCGRLLPSSVRRWIYMGVARNRYRWFGQRKSCRLPSVEEQSRFLL